MLRCLTVLTNPSSALTAVAGGSAVGSVLGRGVFRRGDCVSVSMMMPLASVAAGYAVFKILDTFDKLHECLKRLEARQEPAKDQESAKSISPAAEK